MCRHGHFMCRHGQFMCRHGHFMCRHGHFMCRHGQFMCLTWTLHVSTWTVHVSTWTLHVSTWTVHVSTWTVHVSTWTLHVSTWTVHVSTWTLHVLTWTVKRTSCHVPGWLFWNQKMKQSEGVVRIYVHGEGHLIGTLSADKDYMYVEEIWFEYVISEELYKNCKRLDMPSNVPENLKTRPSWVHSFVRFERPVEFWIEMLCKRAIPITLQPLTLKELFCLDNAKVLKFKRLTVTSQPRKNDKGNFYVFADKDIYINQRGQCIVSISDVYPGSCRKMLSDESERVKYNTSPRKGDVIYWKPTKRKQPDRWFTPTRGVDAFLQWLNGNLTEEEARKAVAQDAHWNMRKLIFSKGLQKRLREKYENHS